MTPKQLAVQGGALLLFFAFVSGAAANAMEDIAFAQDPTAEKAYQLGVQHLDATVSHEYDIKRAGKYFTKALELDPAYPNARYGIARVEFLNGNLYNALDLLNEEVALTGEPDPSVYYLRALVKGYMRDYISAGTDYEQYFKIAPANWGAINDYAWVLIKARHFDAALSAVDWGLSQWPENAWLLNTRVVALYETGKREEAKIASEKAAAAAQAVSEAEWLGAYPGNDPLVAPDGLRQFRSAAEANQMLIRENLGN